MNNRPAPKLVFVSHAVSQTPFVRRLVAELHEALNPGFVFVESNPAGEGESIFGEVAEKIRRCDLMIYVASEDASESQANQAELAWGLAQGQTRGDFRISHCSAERPRRFPTS